MKLIERLLHRSSYRPAAKLCIQIGFDFVWNGGKIKKNEFICP